MLEVVLILVVVLLLIVFLVLIGLSVYLLLYMKKPKMKRAESTTESLVPTSQEEIKVGDTLGDNPETEREQLNKQQQEEIEKKAKQERKELDAIMVKNMERFEDAMRSTIAEIMTGKTIKDKEATK